MARIFISYRRDDSGGWAGRLYDRLSQYFGRDHVFMDIDTIEPGLDFAEVIEQAVGSCDALVALIGKQWLTITDASGRRRLENPEDFVRLEIATALARNIRVIPALVHGASVPGSSDLPDALKILARRKAYEISDTRFHYDVDRLIEVLDKVLGVAKPLTDENGDVAITRRPLTSAQPRKKSSTIRLPFKPEMILIPAGEFLMGSDHHNDPDAEENEQPQHSLHLPDYYLAKTPVTNAQFAAFVQAAGWQDVGTKWAGNWAEGKPPPGKADHPVNEVAWDEAMAYCRWLSGVTGKAYGLPSEAEWEKGARGAYGRIYPWGNQWEVTRCNTHEGGWKDTTRVSTYPQGASPYGVLDMAGNVWEWTPSLCDSKYPYNPEDGRENLDVHENSLRVLRGGGFYNVCRHVRCAFRGRFSLYSRARLSGFRVVMHP